MKNKKWIFKYLVLFTFIISFNMIVVPVNLDEIWCYGFALNISKGLVPYRDFNMVITPLYPFLTSIFLLFSKNILMFHLGIALIITLMSYFIFDLIDKKAWIVFMVFFLLGGAFFPGYNILIFLFLVLLIWLEKKKSNDLVIGIIIALAFLTKQSVGLLFLIPTFIYIKDLNKVFRRLLGFLIPILIFLIYLLLTNSLMNFIDLCFLGLFDFAESNGRLLNLELFIFIFMILITIYFMKHNKNDINFLYILTFYSLIFPLFDLKHLQQVFLGFIFMILYYDKFRIKPDYSYFLLFVFIIIPYAFIILNYRDILNTEYPNHIKYFEYRLIDKDAMKITEDVNNYLKKNGIKKFVLLDGNGYYFKIINDIDIGYIDLINAGNWGYNGTNKLLKDIKQKKDYIFIVDEEELKGDRKQSDRQAIKYIIKNGKKIDSINFYDVYILE